MSDDFKPTEARGQLEVYWRGGYRIQGAERKTITSDAQSRRTAESKAIEAAEEVRRTLAGLGLNPPIEVWLQRWTRQRVELSYEREVSTAYCNGKVTP